MKKQISLPVAIGIIAVFFALIGGISWYLSGNRAASAAPVTGVTNALSISPTGSRTLGNGKSFSAAGSDPTLDMLATPVSKGR